MEWKKTSTIGQPVNGQCHSGSDGALDKDKLLLDVIQISRVLIFFLFHYMSKVKEKLKTKES